jgi:CRP-like cAMP-binding protein
MSLIENPSECRAENNRDVALVENPFAYLANRSKEVFSNLPPPQRYPQGTELFKQGSRLQDVYCIDQGMIKIVRLNRTGRAVIVGLRFPGWILGIAPIMLNKPSLVTAVTLTNSSLHRIQSEDLLRLVRTDAQLSRHLHLLLSQEVYEQVIRLCSPSARRRFEHLLLQMTLALELGGAQDEIKLQVPLKSKEMAQIIAVTPQHFSRILNEMEQEGVIRREKGWIIVSDFQKLQTTKA